ncbi:hypothetical protein CMQ_471 [Grosmannia clavigera kw1407]|uniref:Uncharacterized protein n=1 Tax=Grosmannia clavigera (strain kw1407 / UAMH 11150) TaxID=655863 RepID=F0XC92_GROCL|nr:uncharacterized protein CMQ_471 [Grosmannia clavigera kw1407]EFX03543.1 hypothetical protein CMQ_471 [Grosmannia clavigera kw1407]
MRSRLLLSREDCSSGTQYYTCASNGFSGCCSVDACDYSDGCPDSSATESSGISSSTVTTIVTTPTTSSQTPVTPSPSSTAAQNLPSISSSASDPYSTPLTRSAASKTSHIATSTTGHTASSTPSTGVGSGSTPSPAAISKGAVAGIITAGVLAFVLLAAFLIWRHCWRRPTRQQTQQTQQPEKPEQRAAGVLEKGPDNGGTGSVASPQTTSPVDGSTASLFGEVSAIPGTLEAVLARWGLHGARLTALRHKRLTGSLRSRNDIADLGSYLGPVAGTPARLAELDAQGPAVLAELESQTTNYSPLLPQHSPAMSSSTGRRTTAATFVSSWRSSSTGSAAGMLGPDVVTPELDSTPRMEIMSVPLADTKNQGLPFQAPTTDWPRATLDVTHKEQTHGLHVGSWASYRP